LRAGGATPALYDRPMTTPALDSPAAAAGSLLLGGSLPVHRMGFGAMRITGEGVWGPPRDRAAACAVLRRAVELGVNLIDTADSYGPAVSEELIAEALYPYPRGLVIATKGGLVRPGPDVWERKADPAHLRAACEANLRRLRVECIDLYQLHAPDPAVPLEDSLGALADLQRAGKVRLVGVSSVCAEELARARRIVEVVTVQNRYNLEYRVHEDVIAACEQAGIGFIPWYPLGAGPLLHGTGRSPERAAALRQVAERHGVTAAQVALAWLLRRSPVMLPIPGTGSVAHLEENVAGAAVRLTDADCAELDR
jgi:pyridoxine 4-dehydrogenase